MHFSMNADWARFKRRGIAMLGRAGFADWLQHAADVVRAEAKREVINATYSEPNRELQDRNDLSWKLPRP